LYLIVKNYIPDLLPITFLFRTSLMNMLKASCLEFLQNFFKLLTSSETTLQRTSCYPFCLL